MNTVIRLLSYLYELLLRAYQSPFRRQYGEEMQQVFHEALEEAASQGWRKMLLVFWRELHDLPANLARESRDGPIPADGKSIQELENSLLADQPPDSWRGAILAGSPHLLYALGLFLPAIAGHGFNPLISLLSSSFTFWLLVFMAILYAWKGGWPRWSHSWIGYGLVFILHQLNALFPSGPLALMMIFTWLTLVLITLLWLARRDWLGGLLAALPITPMWVWRMSIEGTSNRSAESILYISIGLLVALAVAAIVRVGRWQTAVWLILAVILAAGLPLSYGTSLFNNAPTIEQGEPDGMSLLIGVIGNYAAILVFTAPLWLLALWRQVRQWRAPI
ncbi:MAG: hypothetical protein JSV61_06920 [Anaerolineales bacterium]|nr:MAG: hypothetical protein JSV61_06920 [Anaerolineales bacterium]